jgi:hypothetical protein
MLHVDNDLCSPLIAIPRRYLGYYSFPAYVMVAPELVMLFCHFCHLCYLCHLDPRLLPALPAVISHSDISARVSLDTMLSKSGEYNTTFEKYQKAITERNFPREGRTRSIGC